MYINFKFRIFRYVTFDLNRNIKKYVNEFNSRLKAYNVEITYFNIKRK